jgi:hypothetical protein
MCPGGGPATNLRRGWKGRSQRPIHIRRHVRLAAKAACTDGCYVFGDRAGDEKNATSRQVGEPWCPFRQPGTAQGRFQFGPVGPLR